MSGFTPRVRATIRERAGCTLALTRCEKCGVWTAEIHLHHRRPRGMGGSRDPQTNTAANGVAVCGLCHNRIEMARADSIATGWLVRQCDNPAKTPILMDGQWVLLTDDGMKVGVAA